MNRAVVIGSPIDHSLSPVLHQAGYEATGLIDWSYSRECVQAEEVPEFLATLDPDVVGVSVTMPCKEAALAYAHESSDLAREVGGANTLVRRHAGWFADNTDVAGVRRALKGAGCGEANSAVILGSGATARSCLAAIAQLGVAKVIFGIRAQVRPETSDLAKSYGMDVATLSLDDERLIDAMTSADIVLSTLPANAATPLAEELAARGSASGTFFDVVYANWPTPIARAADEIGMSVVSGLDMLIEQAAVQFEMFTGMSAPVADMRAAAWNAVEG